MYSKFGLKSYPPPVIRSISRIRVTSFVGRYKNLIVFNSPLILSDYNPSPLTHLVIAVSKSILQLNVGLRLLSSRDHDKRVFIGTNRKISKCVSCCL